MRALNAAQIAILRNMAAHKGGDAWTSAAYIGAAPLMYKFVGSPAEQRVKNRLPALIRRGFVRPSPYREGWFMITAAGRAALAKATGSTEEVE